MKKSSASLCAFFFAALVVAAQTNTDYVPVRAMALQDCIQKALTHNLDVQIERINPQISLYDLRADYGGYDPTLSVSGQHNHDESGPDGAPVSVSDANTFKSSLNGATPWGMIYGLSANASKNYATVQLFG
jgi:outer membrane protein TolC